MPTFQPSHAVFAAILVLAALAPAAVADEGFIPQSLREGWGFADDIRDLGESLDGGYELTERDIDCDGRGEVLLERLAMRGAKGNRGYLLFDHGSGGYRYLGEIGAIWAAVDYGDAGGCYLTTYSKKGGGRLTLTVTSTEGGAFEALGAFEMVGGDAGTDDDNALLSALRAGGLDEGSLRALAIASRRRAVEVASVYPPLGWVESSTVEEVMEEVAGSGRQLFERVRPEAVQPAPASPWWGPISDRAARQWAVMVEERIVDVGLGETAEALPPWLPPAGAGRLEIRGSKVEEAIRLNLPLGKSPVGLAIGRFDAVLGSAEGEPALAVEITWAGAFSISRFGSPEGILRLFVGTAGDGEGRRLFRLERLTNLDHDREQEVVLEEQAYAGRLLWLLDFSRVGEVDVRRLHAAAWN